MMEFSYYDISEKVKSAIKELILEISCKRRGKFNDYCDKINLNLNIRIKLNIKFLIDYVE